MWHGGGVPGPVHVALGSVPSTTKIKDVHIYRHSHMFQVALGSDICCS